MIQDLILKNRSYRRFYESEKISIEDLYSFINLARLSPSAKNMQPLKYIISNDEEKNEMIFQTLMWAGYLKNWNGPEKGERPSAYIVILKDTSLSDNIFCDDGIAIQSMLLGAVGKGFGGCIIGSVNRKKLQESLEIPEHLDILYVLALGKPKEEVVIEELGEDGDIKYWRDKDGVHHVPKRELSDLILML